MKIIETLSSIDWTLIIAIWGAIIGTFSLIYSIREFHKAKRTIFISYEYLDDNPFRSRAITFNEPINCYPGILIRVYNSGFRQIMINKLKIKMLSGKDITDFYSRGTLPNPIETNGFMDYFFESSVCVVGWSQKDRVKEIIIEDIEGKVFRKRIDKSIVFELQ